jgi:hypothetical protein
MDTQVIAQIAGGWFINYYVACERELAQVREEFPGHWAYLLPFWVILTQREAQLYNRSRPDKSSYYSPIRTYDDITEFLRREHIQTHRDFSPAASA